MASKIKILLAVTVASLMSLIPLAAPAGAACIAGETCGQGVNSPPLDSSAQTTTQSSTSSSCDICHPEACGGSKLTNEQLNSCEACKKANVKGCLDRNPIVGDLQKIIDILSAGVGIVVVAMIIIGGIQYSVAGDNPQKVTDAKKRITDALIALVVFMFIFAFVQWLIPGGIFP